MDCLANWVAAIAAPAGTDPAAQADTLEPFLLAVRDQVIGPAAEAAGALPAELAGAFSGAALSLSSLLLVLLRRASALQASTPA